MSLEERVLRVSVVITAFNRADLLEVTLGSLLDEQTFSGFEVIICDDASTDRTPEVCTHFAHRDARVRVIRNDVNLGMPQNLNRGIAAAQGEYIANLHEDDAISSNLLAAWMAALDACPNAGFVFNAYDADVEGRDDPRLFTEDIASCNSGSTILERLFFRRWRFTSPVWGTVMARRSAYETLGLFDERFGLLADVDMWMRLSEVGDVAYVREPLIRIASQERAPHRFQITRRRHRRLVQRMFLEARLRHFRGWKLALELARHASYIVMDLTYWEMLRMWRLLKQVTAAMRRRD